MKKTASLLISLFVFVNLHAQKLPNIQQAGVRAPANIKIDGSLTEWSEQLQAYNTVDDLFYTVSNDDNNLYLTLVAPYKFACKKILIGGVMFSVSKIADKKSKDDPSKKAIDFVLLKSDQRRELSENFEKYLNKKTKNPDSVLKLINKKLAAMLKTFDINREIIPVYNDLNIVAAARFNKNLDLVYELSVPLSYIGINKDYAAPFSYNICLSAADAAVRVMRWKYSPEHPNPPPPPSFPPGTVLPPPNPLYTSTDFWANYTLVK
nr:hypothetical protein [uncultured Mucilaginibacter sp.]